MKGSKLLTAYTTKIFVVYAQEINLVLLQGILEDDYQIQCFTCGLSFLQAFEKNPADIVLLDVEMPTLDGLEICRRILRIQPQCPVIFVSANSSDHERLEGYSAGGYDYISKPCNANELLAKLAVIVNQQERKRIIDGKNESISTSCMEMLRGSGAHGELKASILIEGEKGNHFWSDRGECSPIEAQVLETLRDKGRIYEFRNQLQVNETYVSVLIRNMPEDEMICGRLKDSIPFLL
jgi:DNA-binding response OmpR family regulator